VKVHVSGSDVVAAMDIVGVALVEKLVAAAAAENKT